MAGAGAGANSPPPRSEETVGGVRCGLAGREMHALARELGWGPDVEPCPPKEGASATRADDDF